MFERYMTQEEKAAVRKRMIADAEALEAEAVQVLKDLIVAVEDGSIRNNVEAGSRKTPFHEKLDHAADCWTDAQELREASFED
jgi:hypothetical protein